MLSTDVSGIIRRFYLQGGVGLEGWGLGEAGWERAQPRPLFLPSRAPAQWWMREKPTVYFPWKPRCWCGAGDHNSRYLIKNPACVLGRWMSKYSWLKHHVVSLMCRDRRGQGWGWGWESEMHTLPPPHPRPGLKLRKCRKGQQHYYLLLGVQNSSALWVAAAPWWAEAHSFVLFFKEGLSDKYFKQQSRGIPKGCWNSILRVLFLDMLHPALGRPPILRAPKLAVKFLGI